jgi:predicted nucleic acid-binding protein
VWVLDASVAAKWFFAGEPNRDRALAVRGLLAHRPEQFAVPHLFHSELLHVLARKSAGDPVFVERGFDLVLHLGIRTLGLSKAAWQSAAAWSCRGLSGYDATYVALAEDLDGKWLTADEAACRRVGSKVAHSLARWR